MLGVFPRVQDAKIEFLMGMGGTIHWFALIFLEYSLTFQVLFRNKSPMGQDQPFGLFAFPYTLDSSFSIVY